MKESISINVRRSQLGRARGVGAGHSGVEHWRIERITSIALVPLTLWFIYAMLHLVGAPQEAVAAWAGHPVNTVLLLVLVVITFHHMHLGLQVVFEDYVANKWQMTLMILGAKSAALLLGLMASVAVLKLALS
jgi:succinate dehydrogenase / fumarate reductase, membrane anchor subunit